MFSTNRIKKKKSSLRKVLSPAKGAKYLLLVNLPEKKYHMLYVLASSGKVRRFPEREGCFIFQVWPGEPATLK